MAVARPFLELHVRQSSEPLALALRDRPSEDAEAGHVELRDDLCVDPCLELRRIRAQQQFPVAEDDLLLHLMRLEH